METTLALACLVLAIAAGNRDGSQPAPSEQGNEPEATSLFGKPLFAPVLSDDAKRRLEADLEAARKGAAANPTSVDAWIWVGRRLAYLGRYREAIASFTEGLERFGRNAKLLRHRGHRYITVRRFDLAVKDLAEAAKLIEGTADEVEPDGVPNRLNSPISSLHSNVWYHLALAHYLTGDFNRALEACQRGGSVSNNADKLVSQSYWLVLTLRRLGKIEQSNEVLAKFDDSLSLIENEIYLKLLLHLKGSHDSVLSALEDAKGVDLATLCYGIGMSELLSGNRASAVERFKRAMTSETWAAFGYIAAEAELKRLGETP